MVGIQSKYVPKWKKSWESENALTFDPDKGVMLQSQTLGKIA